MLRYFLVSLLPLSIIWRLLYSMFCIILSNWGMSISLVPLSLLIQLIACVLAVVPPCWSWAALSLRLRLGEGGLRVPIFGEIMLGIPCFWRKRFCLLSVFFDRLSRSCVELGLILCIHTWQACTHSTTVNGTNWNKLERQVQGVAWRRLTSVLAERSPLSSMTWVSTQQARHC